MSEPLLLKGLNGGNPLAFMALLGVAQMCWHFSPDIRISWVRAEGTWHPLLHGFAGGEDEFLQCVLEALASSPSQPFLIDKKLPFEQKELRSAMCQSLRESKPMLRRTADLLAGFGSDAYADKDGIFFDSSFRMVRSGDSSGQGLPAYAQAIREGLTLQHLRMALLDSWRYEDDAFSLRWDPVEDQRYALRWYDPSQQANKKHSLRTMRGANALALEGLALLPVQPQLYGVATTNFSRLEQRRVFFTWPIWDVAVTLDVVRSVLTIPELAARLPDRETLRAIGIAEIYRSERIAPNQYYKNFTPARPV